MTRRIRKFAGRSLVGGALWVAAGVAGMQPVAAGDLVTSISQIKKSLVGVATCALTRRPPIALRGTGFAVADGHHVVTNFHVVDVEQRGPDKEFLCIVYGSQRNAKFEPTRIVAKDETHDVAILAFDGPRFVPARLGDDERVPDGLAIAFTGYPIAMVLGLNPVTHRGIVAARTPIAIPQFRSEKLDARMVKQLRNLFEVFQLDATAYPGNSGSPLYDQRSGRILGIVSSVFVKGYKENILSHPSGITYAIPISHARKLIKGLGLAPGRGGQISRDTP